MRDYAPMAFDYDPIAPDLLLSHSLTHVLTYLPGSDGVRAFDRPCDADAECARQQRERRPRAGTPP